MTRYPAAELSHDVADRLGFALQPLRILLRDDVFTDEADTLLAPLAAISDVTGFDLDELEERLAGFVVLDDEHYL